MPAAVEQMVVTGTGDERRVSVAGTGQPGTEVQVVLDDTSVTTATVDESGKWSIDAALPLTRAASIGVQIVGAQGALTQALSVPLERVVVDLPTPTPIPTNTATSEPTATSTETPVPLPTATATAPATSTATDTPVPTATSTPVPTATETATSTPPSTHQSTSVPTETSTGTPTPAPTATPTETPTPAPTATATPVPPQISSVRVGEDEGALVVGGVGEPASVVELQVRVSAGCLYNRECRGQLGDDRQPGYHDTLYGCRGDPR